MSGGGVSTRARQADAAVRVVEARVLRRVVRKHRKVSATSVATPHGIGYALPGEAAAALTTADERGDDGGALPSWVLLVPRPEQSGAGALRQRWRAEFHLRVHVALEEKRKAGQLTEAIVRARRHRIGQTELDEIRAVLHHDELLLPRADAIDEYVELAAYYSELAAFAPHTLAQTFPGLDRARIEETLALDLDAGAILSACKPEGLEEPVAQPAPSTAPPPLASRRISRVSSADELEAARKRGNVVRAALEGSDARADLEALTTRLSAAVSASLPDDLATTLAHLVTVAQRTPAPTLSIEARVLYDLQRACVDAERPTGTVDVLGAIGSLFRKKIVRTQPARREVQVARHCHRALEKLPRTRLAPEAREAVGVALRRLEHLADEGVRAALRPRIAAALAAVSLRPANVPEEVAEHKLVEELVDHVLVQGTFSLPHLRDAIARNRLKCSDVSPSSLLFGDELLRADARLSDELDGVYRRGEIYLRGLQKLSSLAFGTRPGRLLTMYLVLPILGAFVVLEGLSHLLHPLARKLFHVHHLHLLTRPSLAAVSVLIFALLHSAGARAVGKAVLSAIFAVLHGVFVAAPVWLFTRPVVLTVARSAPVQLFLRFVAKPATVAVPAYFLARRLLHLPPRQALVAALVALPLVSLTMNSRLFALFEEIVLDGLARGARNVRKRVLPGVLSFLLDAIRAVVEWVERVLYQVGERLLFRPGDSKVGLAFKGVASFVWGIFTFLLRFYVNLLIEPQVNPIKHFPVVTVSHKIILPMLPTLLVLMRAPLMPLGAVVANTIAGVTCFLLPGVFGFLAWELKENRRLYRAALPPTLEPVRIGSHGETMTGLLVPGFHSGTLPKIEAAIRRAARRVDRRDPFWRLALRTRTRAETDRHHVEEAIATFVERELLALLERSPRWTAGPLRLARVELGSNRIRLHLTRSQRESGEGHELGAAHCPLVLAFEEQSGLILAERVRDSLLDELSEQDRAALLAALDGFCHLADVDFTREALERAVGGRPYDVCDEGLAVWSPDWSAEALYDLSASGPTEAVVVEGQLSLPAIDPPALRPRPVAWDSWVRDWSPARA